MGVYCVLLHVYTILRKSASLYWSVNSVLCWLVNLGSCALCDMKTPNQLLNCIVPIVAQGQKEEGVREFYIGCLGQSNRVNATLHIHRSNKYRNGVAKFCSNKVHR